MFAGSVESWATPIYTISNLLIKLEYLTIGGSHKARSARWMIRRAIASGELSREKTIIEKTGGNLGIGLAIEAAKHGIAVELAVGLSFSARKKKMLTQYGASLIGDEMLQKGALPRDVINFHIENQDRMGKSYTFLDQFSNPANIEAHVQETGPEIIKYIQSRQLEEKCLFFVGGVGSGASVSGVGLALKKAFPHTQVVAIQPQGCDIMREVFTEHELQGIAVGIKPPILRPDIIDRWVSCSETHAFESQKWLLQKHGIFVGPTTGANLHVAQSIAQQHRNSIVITLAYDSGESYD